MLGDGEGSTLISLLYVKMQCAKEVVDEVRSWKHRVKGQENAKESREILKGGWSRTLFLGVPSRRGRGDVPSLRSMNSGSVWRMRENATWSALAPFGRGSERRFLMTRAIGPWGRDEG